MTAFAALIHREFIEHRGAFRIAPVIILTLLTLIVVSTLLFRQNATMMIGAAGISASAFEIGFAGFAWLWWLYLLCILVLYFPESFYADKRGNSMLFWKSMPQSDFKMLLAKFFAGLTILPLCIVVAAMVSGLILYGVIAIGTMTIPGAANLSQGLGPDLINYLQISLGAVAFYGLGLLWFVPFFAWAGALGAIFGRWAIPIGFLVPAAIGLAEYLVLGSSHFVQWLTARTSYMNDFGQLTEQLAGRTNIGVAELLPILWQQIDVLQMVLGWVFALGVIFIASEFRRRSNDN